MEHLYVFIFFLLKKWKILIPNCPFLARETFLNITECKEPESKMLEFIRFSGYKDEEKIYDGMQIVFIE